MLDQGQKSAANAPPRGPERLGRYELVARLGAGILADVYLARPIGAIPELAAVDPPRAPSQGFALARSASQFRRGTPPTSSAPGLTAGPVGRIDTTEPWSSRSDSAGSAVVYRIHAHLARAPEFVDALLDEARASALIAHPHVVDIYDLGVSRGVYFVAMEYLAGQPLQSLIAAAQGGAAGERLDALSTARLIADAASGLHAAHELRSPSGRPLELVHRGVCPDTIYALYDGGVKLTDFGMARVRELAARLVGGGVPAAARRDRAGYAAPEQQSGGAVDWRGDVFSLGVTMWEALALRGLFTAAEGRQAVRRHAPPPPSTHRPDVPAALDRICLRALAADPMERFQTAREMQLAIESFLADGGFRREEGALARFMNRAFAAEREAGSAALRRLGEAGRASARALPARSNGDRGKAGGGDRETGGTDGDTGERTFIREATEPDRPPIAQGSQALLPPLRPPAPSGKEPLGRPGSLADGSTRTGSSGRNLPLPAPPRASLAPERADAAGADPDEEEDDFTVVDPDKSPAPFDAAGMTALAEKKPATGDGQQTPGNGQVSASPGRATPAPPSLVLSPVGSRRSPLASVLFRVIIRPRSRAGDAAGPILRAGRPSRIWMPALVGLGAAALVGSLLFAVLDGDGDGEPAGSGGEPLAGAEIAARTTPWGERVRVVPGSPSSSPTAVAARADRAPAPSSSRESIASDAAASAPPHVARARAAAESDAVAESGEGASGIARPADGAGRADSRARGDGDVDDAGDADEQRAAAGDRPPAIATASESAANGDSAALLAAPTVSGADSAASAATDWRRVWDSAASSSNSGSPPPLEARKAAGDAGQRPAIGDWQSANRPETATRPRVSAPAASMAPGSGSPSPARRMGSAWRPGSPASSTAGSTAPEPMPDASRRMASTASPDELYREGARLYVAGRFDEARRKFQAALAASPRFAPAHRGLGLIYERSGDAAQAARSFQSYLRLAPGAADAAAIRARLGRLRR